MIQISLSAQDVDLLHYAASKFKLYITKLLLFFFNIRLNQIQYFICLNINYNIKLDGYQFCFTLFIQD